MARPDINGRPRRAWCAWRLWRRLWRRRGVWAAVRGALNVSCDDIIRVAKVTLRHRIILNFEGEAQQIKVDDLIDKLLSTVKTAAARGE